MSLLGKYRAWKQRQNVRWIKAHAKPADEGVYTQDGGRFQVRPGFRSTTELWRWHDGRIRNLRVQSDASPGHAVAMREPGEIFYTLHLHPDLAARADEIRAGLETDPNLGGLFG